MNADRAAVQSRHWSVSFDRGRYWRAKLGFVLLPNTQTAEEDLFRMAPAGVGVFSSRCRMQREVTVENLAAMVETLAQTAEVILPDEDLDVVCYSCTSGSIVIGEGRVVAELERGAPGAKATTLVTGVVEGLRAVGARRIVVGTPYLDEVNTVEAAFLRKRGFEVLEIQGMNLRYDSEIAAVSPDYLVEFAQAIDRPEADAIFISCGGLRTVEAIDAIERATGKPVIASNQAMFWHCLRLAGIDDRVPGYGRLFQEH